MPHLNAFDPRDPAGVGAGRRREDDAKTTPHIFVINTGRGKRVYMGGIEDVPTPPEGDLARAEQLVEAALEEVTVSTPTWRPCGCNVKDR